MRSVLRESLTLRRANLQLSSLLVLPALLGPAAAQAAPPSLSSYMECARAIGLALHERFTVIPTKLADDKGLLFFTDHGASFVALGAPHSEDSAAFEFLLKASVSGVGDVFLNVREKKPGVRTNNPSEIGYQTTPPVFSAASYRPAPATAASGDFARDVLSRTLREKIATVKYFIDAKSRFSTPREAKLAFEQDRRVFLAKLAQCRLEGDRELNLAVSDEVQKLETGFPVVTIWETQIGSRHAVAKTR
jgi:hypothetical protein